MLAIEQRCARYQSSLKPLPRCFIFLRHALSSGEEQTASLAAVRYAPLTFKSLNSVFAFRPAKRPFLLRSNLLATTS